MKKRWLAIIIAVVMVSCGLNVAAFGQGDADEAQPAETVQSEAPAAKEELKEDTSAKPEDPEKEKLAEEPAEGTSEEAVPAEEAPEEEVPAEKIPEEEISVEETAEELRIGLSNVSRYVFAGDRAYATLTVKGGVAPYAVSFDGKEAVMDEAGTASLSVVAKKGGELEFEATVVDAEGTEKSVSAKVPVAVDDKGDYKKFLKAAKRVKLTGDWHMDIVAVAASQLGYKESDKNFIIRDDGSKQGWTVYGDQFGLPYEEWCAMFASFCVQHALGDYKGYFPVEEGCNAWIGKLGGAYVNDEDNYDPKPGDLIFFNTDQESDADHVGIVEYAADGIVHTIEGNSSRSVERCSYSMRDKTIMGYVNIEVLMKNAGLIEEPAESEPSEENIEETEVPELSEDGEMEAVVDELLEDMLEEMPVIIDERLEGEEAEMTEEIAAWVAETGATEEMIARALKAGSLDSLVLEGNQLIYVRTGEVIATYDSETGKIIDNNTSITVAAIVDGTPVFPIFDTETADA